MGIGLILLGGVGVAALLPIWRGAGHTRHDGVTLPRLLYDSNKGVPGQPFRHPHVRYEVAAFRARQAWEEQYGS